jgi:diadenosine tetraphosphate (Ap4A) HIT family hydrolase
MTVDYVDVETKAELPPTPTGLRYLDFLGGDKELRCFLVPQDMPRSHFMSEHADLLDEALHPVYQHNGICVRQDASYALPGFYIVSLDDHYSAMDRLDEATHLRVALVIRELRSGMRDALGIEYVHLHYEEKPDQSCNVHYWVMPVLDRQTMTTTVIMRLDIRQYLSGFRFRDERKQICANNEKMREYFQLTKLARRDDGLVPRLAADDKPCARAALGPTEAYR